MQKRRRRLKRKSIFAPVFLWLVMMFIITFTVQGVHTARDALPEEKAKRIIALEIGIPFSLQDTGLFGGRANKNSEKTDSITFEKPNKEGGKNKTELTVFDGGRIDPSVIRTDNKTGYDIDVEELVNSPLAFKISGDEPSVLIVHTHTSEAYTQTEENPYTESDPYRTENTERNVVRVGKELKKELESYGIAVLHDTTLHDYPSYNGSYSRSLETVNNILKEYPSIKIVIDLHRDAIAASDGTQLKTLAEVNGETCSQLLLVMGTDATGLSHPNWRENLKLALKLEYAMNTLYPSLAKPVMISSYRYNQDTTTGSMILEAGCAGNTLEESLRSMKYFARACAEVLLGS